MSAKLLLCKPMDYSPPGSSVRGILQERLLEWLAIPFSRGPSQPRDRTSFSCTAGRVFTTEPPGKPHFVHLLSNLLSKLLKFSCIYLVGKTLQPGWWGSWNTLGGKNNLVIVHFVFEIHKNCFII